jgi:hypothetical protein
MHNLRKLSLSVVLTLVLLAVVMPAWAQAEDELVLSLSRDFGYGGMNGVDIQGTFSMKAEGPADLAKVAFYIDETLIGEDSQAPYKIQFNTDNYGLGMHRLRAQGTTSAGETLQSNVYQKNFVSAGEGWKSAMSFLVPVLVLTLGISLISILGPVVLGGKKTGSIPLGARRNYGFAGGTICPKCNRPFALNFMAPNMILGKLARCPHCGKVGIFTRQSPAMLRMAEEAELALAKAAEPQVQGLSEAEKLKKELDDSRFQGM